MTIYPRRSPLESDRIVPWLGDVRHAVYGGDQAARGELGLKLIALAADAAGVGDDPDALAEICEQTIAESNKLLAVLDGALVSFDEPSLSPDDLGSVIRDPMRLRRVGPS